MKSGQMQRPLGETAIGIPIAYPAIFTALMGLPVFFETEVRLVKGL